MPILDKPRTLTPKISAAEAISGLLNIRHVPSISPDEVIRMFREHRVPRAYQHRLGEIFYDAKRWGVAELKRFMAENGLAVEDIAATYYSMERGWQSEAFQKVLDDGELG